MMLRNLPLVLVPLALLYPAASHGGLFGPSNYDECITDSMKGVSSDVAARAIIESCRNLFPEPGHEAAPQAASKTATTTDAAVAPAAAPTAAVAPAPIDTAGARSLTADELARLTATAKVFGSTYRVTVDNGNPNLTLTDVTIAVWDDDDAILSRKEYTEATRIAPLTSALVKYAVHYRGDETTWNWGVVAARGVE